MPKKKEESLYANIPLGLGMALAQDADAMSYFGSLSKPQKEQILGYVKGGSTGQEAKERVNSAVNMLRNGKLEL